MITAIILAAGQSKRMGTAKMLLPFGESTIIESVLQSVLSSKVDHVLVVTGARREKIEQTISHLPAETVFNPGYITGMLSSVQCGFEHADTTAEAAVVVLGDQPSLSPATIDHLIDAYRQKKKGIVLPVFHGRRGHPILIDMKYKEEIQHLNPHIGLRELIRNHAGDIFEVEVGTDSILQDIDTPKDYEKEIEGPENTGSEIDPD
jgi:molybdenum cofactor cytidylyltransferase